MDIPIGIRLGEAVSSLGYDPTIRRNSDGGTMRAFVSPSYLDYDFYRVSGILGLSKERLGNVIVSGNERDSLLLKVYGRENADEMERVGEALSSSLGLPVRVVLERP